MERAELLGRQWAERVRREAPYGGVTGLLALLGSSVRLEPWENSFGACFPLPDGSHVLKIPDDEDRRFLAIPHEAAEALYFVGLGQCLRFESVPCWRLQLAREEGFCNAFARAFLDAAYSEWPP